MLYTLLDIKPCTMHDKGYDTVFIEFGVIVEGVARVEPPFAKDGSLSTSFVVGLQKTTIEIMRNVRTVAGNRTHVYILMDGVKPFALYKSQRLHNYANDQDTYRWRQVGTLFSQELHKMLINWFKPVEMRRSNPLRFTVTYSSCMVPGEARIKMGIVLGNTVDRSILVIGSGEDIDLLCTLYFRKAYVAHLLVYKGEFEDVSVWKPKFPSNGLVYDTMAPIRKLNPTADSPDKRRKVALDMVLPTLLLGNSIIPPLQVRGAHGDIYTPVQIFHSYFKPVSQYTTDKFYTHNSTHTKHMSGEITAVLAKIPSSVAIDIRGLGVVTNPTRNMQLYDMLNTIQQTSNHYEWTEQPQQTALIEDRAKTYLSCLHLAFAYYVNPGAQVSETLFFPWAIAPTISQISQISNKRDPNIHTRHYPRVLGEYPLTAIHEVLAVIPPSQRNMLPTDVAELMSRKGYIDLFPKNGVQEIFGTKTIQPPDYLRIAMLVSTLAKEAKDVTGLLEMYTLVTDQMASEYPYQPPVGVQMTVDPFHAQSAHFAEVLSRQIKQTSAISNEIVFSMDNWWSSE